MKIFKQPNKPKIFKDIFTLKANNLNKYNEISFKIRDNFNILNSSQIYLNNKSNLYEGYFEVENNLNRQFSKDKLNELKINTTESEINISGIRKEELMSIYQSYRKISVLTPSNKRKIGSIVPIWINRSNKVDKYSDLMGGYEEMNHYYGVIANKVYL